MTETKLRGVAALSALLPALLLAACGGDTAASAGGAADLVLRGGHVVTVDSTLGETSAVAVKGDTIVAVGSDADIERWIGADTRVVELDGRTALPGFVESHGHFMGLGQARMELDLMTPTTWDQIVALVGASAADSKRDSWILGRGWHQEKWSEPPGRVVRGFPTNDKLNDVAPNNPVMLTHASGHASIVNERALELAGITDDTPDPQGGEIIRDSTGKATGILVDAAQGAARRALQKYLDERTPEQVAADTRRQIDLAAQEAISKGVTSFQDQGESFATIETIRKVAEAAELPLRLYVLVSPGEVRSDNEQALAEHRVIGAADDHFTVRAIGEISSDGALGSHSAWLLQPYSDQPSTSGLSVVPPERIREIATIGMRNGFQIATHAIGDRANRETLDVYADLLGQHPDSTDLRWRIEHAQHLSLQDIPRFAKLGVIASMQGIHACSDGPYVLRRLGEKRAEEGAYVWKKLEDSGAVVTNGTDVPVEDIDPIASYRCTVTRELKDGSRFYPDQALSRMTGLETYTTNGAYAAFEEDEKGTLTPGKLADIVVLDRDILTVPDDSLAGAKVVYTFVGGQQVFPADSAAGTVR